MIYVAWYNKMSTFQEILKKEGSQEALLAQLIEAWETTADDKKSEMLHADDDYAFRWACEYGHIEMAKWLWYLCQTAEEQKAMLHAQDRWAFRLACQNGHQKVAEWLWHVCPDEEKKAMLHAQDDYAFGVACDNGHIEIAKWLWDLCQIPEEQSTMLHARDDGAFRVACQEDHLEMAKWVFILYDNDVDTRLKLFNEAMTIKDGMAYVLWPCLNVIEQIQMLNKGFVQDLLKKAIANNDHVYQYLFVSIIGDLVSSTTHQAMYLEYIKAVKHKMDNFLENTKWIIY